MIGQTFGNYRIDEKRGEGGMGMFFRATDLHLDRTVGLKTLRPELVADPDLRERLHGEARSLARLVHQNIANVLHYLVEDDYHFIVMEYIDGKDLGEVVKETGLIPIDRLAAIVPQICAAVSYAHIKGVIHRDLKPSNIMVTADGEVKVTDFGIAKILGAQSQTRTGVAPGSLQYMAPEQISGTDVDQRSDVYQLGATLYELCTGKRPFVSANEYELMTMHLNQMPETPSIANDRVPEVLDGVILKALAKSPDDRYQSVDELGAAFQSAMGGDYSGVGDKTEYAKPRPTPPPASFPPEDPTVVAPARRRAKSESATPDTPPTTGNDNGESRSKLWILIPILVVAVAAVGYFMFPFGAEQSTDPIETPPVTTVDFTPMCSLLVSADLPSSLKPTELSRITLTLDHADSGQSSYDIRAMGAGIREGYIVAPTTNIKVSISGTNADGKTIISGHREIPGTAGTVDAVLSLTHSPASQPITPPPDPPQTHNLTLTITPFSARESITRIWIDNKEVSADGDFEYKVEPGKRRVRLGVQGERLTDYVMVKAGEVTENTKFVATGKGRLSVGAVFPGAGGFANIWLDGVRLEDVGTPTILNDILEGPHMVEVRQDGFRARGGPQIVTVTAGGKAEVSFEMVPD